MLRAIKSLISLYLVIFLAGLAGFFLLINLFNPETSSWYVFAALYFSIFVASFGIATLLVSFVRYVFGSRIGIFSERDVVLRQSSWLGLLVTSGFILQSLRLLNIFTGVLLILVFGILELYFLNK